MELHYGQTLVLLLMNLCIVNAQRNSDRAVPFGIMFDKDYSSVMSALDYKVGRHNDNYRTNQIPGSVTLHVDKRHSVDMNDVFSTNIEFCDLLKSGVFAIFGTHTSNTIDALQAYTSALHMPFITPRLAVNTSEQELGYMLFMKPYYIEGILDVMEKYGWTEVWYMYNSNDGLMRLRQLYEALSQRNYGLRINILRVDGATSGWEALLSVDKIHKGNKRILLDLPFEETEALLKMEESSSKETQHHYFLMELDINKLDLKGFYYGGLNVTGFRMFDGSDPMITSYIDDWKANGELADDIRGDLLLHAEALTIDGVEVLARALSQLKTQSLELFEQGLRDEHNGSKDCGAEFVLPWVVGEDLVSAMKQVVFTGLTGDVRFNQYGLRTGFKLQVLESTEKRPLRYVADWDDSAGLVFKQTISYVHENKPHITDRLRIVTSILTEPFLSLKPNYQQYEGNNQYEGYCADLADRLSRILRIDYEIVPVKDGRYGSKDENGTWNGMVGELMRHEADLCIAPLTITHEREFFIDFSKPFMSTGISIMMKKPQKSAPPDIFYILNPLSLEIWLSLAAAFLGVSTILYFISRFSPCEWRLEEDKDGQKVTNAFTFSNCFWYCFGNLMKQRNMFYPRAVSGRILSAFWWFFALVVTAVYLAMLIRYFMATGSPLPIGSADDLADQTTIKYGTVKSGSTQRFFETSTVPLYEKMWAFMSSYNPSVFVRSNEEAVQKVRESWGRYAFFVESTTNDYVNSRHPCDTIKVGNNLNHEGYGIATPIGSDLRDKVTLATLKLRENGELAKLEKKWWYDKGECGKYSYRQQHTFEHFVHLRVSALAGVFYVLIGALVLAIIIAAVEFLYKASVEAKAQKLPMSSVMKSQARLAMCGKPEEKAEDANLVEQSPDEEGPLDEPSTLNKKSE